jgi:tetratricopeptide (TPR) repeat protein
MKTKIYIIALLVFAVAILGIVYKYKADEQVKKTTVYGLLERKGSAAQTAEWATVKEKAKKLQDAVSADSNDIKSSLGLASLFIQEARITGDYAYYDVAAMKNVNDVLRKAPSNFEALVFKSLIYLSQHHFAEGVVTAKDAQLVNPYNAYVYGLMVDGNVEMGNYDSAIAYADKMVSIRPDLTSYSRISYIREIHGDYKGAIDAMKMAVEAGGPGDEYTEWSRIQLAALLEKTGDLKNAEALYNISLNLRPNYPFALAGLGRMALAAKDYPKAIAYYQKADSLISDNAIQEELADAYRLGGQPKKADETINKLIDDLAKGAESSIKDENLGHYSDRELAYAYLKVNNKNKALEHAMLEYNRRPDNIDVNETVAWVHYSRGEYDKALPFIKAALKTNSKNPVLLTRAALIYDKAGDKALAKTLIAESTKSSPYIDPVLKAESVAVLQSL